MKCIIPLFAAQDLVKDIRNAENVETLKFEGNTFGVAACKGIGGALENHPELKVKICLIG